MKWISIFGFCLVVINVFLINTFPLLILITEPLFWIKPHLWFKWSWPHLIYPISTWLSLWPLVNPRIPSSWPPGLFSNEHITQTRFTRVSSKIKSVDLRMSLSLWLWVVRLSCKPGAEDSHISCHREYAWTNKEGNWG